MSDELGMSDELPPLKVTGSPANIWLVYGDIDRDATHEECAESGEVTWCEDSQYAADIKYARADLAVAPAVASEQWIQEAMRLAEVYREADSMEGPAPKVPYEDVARDALLAHLRSRG